MSKPLSWDDQLTHYIKQGVEPPFGFYEQLWREDPEFIGPVMPPMIAWLKAGSPDRPLVGTIMGNLAEQARGQLELFA